jgi:hypothetical protein
VVEDVERGGLVRHCLHMCHFCCYITTLTCYVVNISHSLGFKQSSLEETSSARQRNSPPHATPGKC